MRWCLSREKQIKVIQEHVHLHLIPEFFPLSPAMETRERHLRCPPGLCPGLDCEAWPRLRVTVAISLGCWADGDIKRNWGVPRKPRGLTYVVPLLIYVQKILRYGLAPHLGHWTLMVSAISSFAMWWHLSQGLKFRTPRGTHRHPKSACSSCGWGSEWGLLLTLLEWWASQSYSCSGCTIAWGSCNWKV